jgi:hypothetical protein
MPASGPHPRSHEHRRVDDTSTRQSAPPIQHESSRLAFRGSAIDVPDRADQEPEPISIAHCRDLLGDDAEIMSDEEVLAVARHAETLAHILIVVALQDVRVH